MSPPAIHLRILLPHGSFLEQTGVRKVVAETETGLFGILPQRLDCAAALIPSILTYQTAEGEEVFVAVDMGILVKTGAEVSVSVRNAVAGAELGDLRRAVDEFFNELDESQRSVQSVIAKLERHFLRNLMQLGHEP